jgi:thioredoxin 1
VIELSRSNFKEVVGREAIVLVSCWAPGCGVCEVFRPVFEKVAERYPQHSFVRMNVGTDEKLGEFFEIAFTPCLMVYRDGLLLLKKPGNYDEQALTDIVEQVQSLDMEMVRADLEASPPEQRNQH